MNLRSRVIVGPEERDDEEEVLIEQEEEEGEVMDTAEKKGVAGDERNIAVLLFLYVLQVDQTARWLCNCLEIHLFRESHSALLLLSPSFSRTKMLVARFG